LFHSIVNFNVALVWHAIYPHVNAKPGTGDSELHFYDTCAGGDCGNQYCKTSHQASQSRN